MSLLSQNRFKNLSPEYIEEQLKLAENANQAQGSDEGDKVASDAQAKDAVIADNSGDEEPVKEAEEKSEDELVDESAYLDMLLEALDEE